MDVLRATAALGIIVVAACTVDFSKYERLGSGGAGAGAGVGPGGSGGAGGVTGPGGGGSTGSCTPGQTQGCYSGPAGTEGVGICAAGTQTCQTDATWGACEGETVPAAMEDCDTPLDENCDSAVNEPPCPCEVGTPFSCYDGPAGTANVGTCSPGQALCEANNMLGPCVGQTLPAPDDCGSPDDEDCSGTSNDHCALWDQLYVGAMADRPYAMALGANDEIYITGEVFGSLTFGNDTLNSAGGGDIFVAKLTAAGDPIWALRWGGAMNEEGRGITVDNAGDVYVAGYHGGPFSIGAIPIPYAGNTDAWVAKIDANGTVQWAQGFGGTLDDRFQGIATDGSDIYIAGRFTNTIDFGLGNVSTPDASQDGVLVKKNAAGMTQWVKQIGTTSSDHAYAVTSDGTSVFVGGWFDAVLDLGMGAPIMDVAGDDAFVAKYTLAGDHQWSTAFGSNGDSEVYAMTHDGNGNVIVGGNFDTDVDVGNGVQAAVGLDDAFVATLDGATGNIMASRLIGGTEDQDFEAIVADAAGNVWITVGMRSETDFGGQTTITGAAESTIAVARYTPTLDLVWVRQFGDSSDQDPRALRLDSMGFVIFAGDCEGTVDFGLGPFTTGGNDVCLAKLEP